MDYLQEILKNQQTPVQDPMHICELETIIRFCDELKSLNSNISPFIYFRKAQALLALGRTEEGMRVLAIAHDIFEENYGTSTNAYTWSKEVSELYLHILVEQAQRVPSAYKALWLYNEAYHLTKEPEQRYTLRQLRQEAYQEMIRTKTPLKKFVWVEEELPLSEPANISSVLLSEIGSLQLVGGALRKNSFWVAHPYKKYVYYDFSLANQLIFNDYINEFLQLMQHLGACRITLEFAEDRQESKISDPAAENLPDDVTGTITRTKVAKTLVYDFKPIQKAHLPTYLVWYASQPTWQAIAAERTQGSLAEFDILLTSVGLLEISHLDINDLEEELSEMIEAIQKVARIADNSPKQKRKNRKSAKSENSDTVLSKDWKELSCHFHVEFTPLSELKEEVQIHELEIVSMDDKPENNTENRKMGNVDIGLLIQEAIELIKPENKPSEEPEKEKLAITEPLPLTAEPIAKDLQNDVRRDLKKATIQDPDTEETAYDKWKKLSKEDIKKETIEPKHERESILDPDLLISPVLKKIEEPIATTKTIENTPELIDSEGLTQEERFYYEMLQHAYQDGSISEDVRKVLERRRQRFKISEVRAIELEKIMLNKK